MKRKVLFGLFVIIILLVIGFIIINAVFNNHQIGYQFAEITRGNLENTISSTGTINPVSKVEVGTQVSGIIDRVYIDFNDAVRKGQLLALLDTIPLKISVLEAEANVEKITAQLQQAKQEYDRNFSMFEKDLISDADFLPYQYNLRMQQAGLKSAEVNLQRAKRNLKYAFITSPINGTVIQRNVEAGQTVAASLQAPTLFIIAEDLSKMEIHAQVDESDIGQIRQGQSVRFDVTTYPDQVFAGIVRQIRLQPEIISNVVNYTVVIDASNEKNLLLPGMTANVDFIIEERKDALVVPNTALRFQPSDEIMAEFRARRQKEREMRPDSSNKIFSDRLTVDKRDNSRTPRLNSDFRQVWFIDPQGNIAMDMVKVGISDGKDTEIVKGRYLQEGMKIIVGRTENVDDKSSDNQGSPRFRRGPRPF